MTDTLTPEQRSRAMAAVRSQNTAPEMIVRRMCYAMGFRYRLHVRKLPSAPDLVFPGRRKVIFVHGCFWHRHTCRRGQSQPKTRAKFWQEKFDYNRRRDKESQRLLRQQGWDVLVVWECQMRDLEELQDRLYDFLTALDECEAV